MGDLKSPWLDKGGSQSPPGLEGDGITDRGSDPNVDAAGSSALQTFFKGAVYPTTTEADETPNPVSGLPKRPARNQPSDTPPLPPDLTNRSPGTIHADGSRGKGARKAGEP